MSDSALTEMIEHNIELQAVMAKHYRFPEHTEIISTYTHMPGGRAQALVRAFRNIFRSTIISSLRDCCYVEIQVSGMVPEARRIFDRLYTENRLNRFLQYFELDRDYLPGRSEPMIYEYDRCGGGVAAPEIKEYIDFLKESFRYSSNYSITVSGFTLEELSTDPYIRQIANVCKHMYLYTFPASFATVEYNYNEKIIKIAF